MSTEAAPHPTGDTAAPAHPLASLLGMDLFSLGRQASEVREARFERRGTFVRSRQLRGPDLWQGPRDAAESTVSEAELPAVGGLDGARRAGATMLLAGRDPNVARAAAEAGLRILWRIEFGAGESDAERIARLDAIRDLRPVLWGLVPTPVGEPYGLDTLRFFALCRLLATDTPHLVADAASLGPRLAQMTFGFGADELRAPIVAERARRLGDNANNPSLTRKEAATLIRGAGLVPCERMADGRLEEVVA